MSKDFMEILKKKPRVSEIKRDPKAVEAIHRALEYAASPAGRGIGGTSVWEALVESGTIDKSYRAFCTYCREIERDLWVQVKSR